MLRGAPRGARRFSSVVTDDVQLANLLYATDGLAVTITSTASRGRGVVARTPLRAGELVCSALPLADSSLSLAATCSPSDDLQPEATRSRFVALWRASAPRVGRLAAGTGGRARRFPLIAAKLAARLACEATPQQSSLQLALAQLCAPRLELDGGKLPAEWLRDHEAISGALRSAALEVERPTDPAGGETARWRRDAYQERKARRRRRPRPDASPARDGDPSVDLSFFTENWYAGVVSRLHLNAMAIGPERSALFGLPSFFNHEHPPNTEVRFDDDDGRAHFIAARDIAEGDECCISYAHDIDDERERRAFLHHNYGFHEAGAGG